MTPRAILIVTAYEIPPPQPGEHSFRCDPHPAMTGTVVVEG